MFVIEFKIKAKPQQYQAIDDAIRTAQFIRNKCLRHWMDNKGVNKYDLSAYCKVLAHDFKFADELNSQARQASAERAWSSISRFFDNCKKKVCKDFAVKLARYVVHSNDVIAYEDLRVKNLVKNHCLAKSINDVAWYQFREWTEYFGMKFGKITIAIPPQYTSQNCSQCGEIVKKSLSIRTHICKCGCVLDRDENAALNILKKGLSTVGHTGTQAWGENANTLREAILSKQAISMNQESHDLA